MPRKYVLKMKRKPKLAQVFEKDSINQKLYNVGTIQRFIQENFYRLTPRQLAQEIGVPRQKITEIMYGMRKEGSIPESEYSASGRPKKQNLPFSKRSIEKKGKAVRVSYTEKSLRDYVQKNFWTIDAKQLAEKFGLSIFTARSVLRQMGKIGAIPRREEVVKEYFKNLKPKERSAENIAASLKLTRRYAVQVSKKKGKKLKPTKGYATRKMYYLANYGIKKQMQMAKELGMDITQLSKELKRFRKEQAIPETRQKEIRKNFWDGGRPRIGEIFKKGDIRQILYPENSFRGIIQRNFFVMSPKQLAEKTGKTIASVNAAIFVMKKEGSLPSSREEIFK